MDEFPYQNKMQHIGRGVGEMIRESMRFNHDFFTSDSLHVQWIAEEESVSFSNGRKIVVIPEITIMSSSESELRQIVFDSLANFPPICKRCDLNHIEPPDYLCGACRYGTLWA